jgi:alpha-beta hydrolase superfamily lysophospholipase
MARTLRRRLRRLGWTTCVLLLLANAGAYGAAWAACRLAGRPPRAALDWLGLRRSGTRIPPALALPHERHLFASEDGTALESWLVASDGRRGVVVLFHGYGGRKTDLLREARAFRDLGLDALLVDFRGSGGSDGDETSIGFHEAKDVRAAVAYARALPGRPRVLAYGVSMGAAAILKAEADGGLRADALILECPFDRLRTAVDHRFEERRLPAFPMSPLLVFWGGWRQGFDGFAHNPVEYARRATTPALLIGGMEDPLVTPDETRSIADALGANGRLLMCPGVGHAPCLRGRPALWRATVSTFVDGVVGPAQAGG